MRLQLGFVVIALVTMDHYILKSCGNLVGVGFSNRFMRNSDRDNRIIANDHIAQSEIKPQDIIDLSFYGSALYGVPDRDLTADRVSKYSTDSDVNPEELGTYLEGDILFPINKSRTEEGRSTVTTLTSRWPGSVVPFEINGDFNSIDLAMIQAAFDAFHDYTCILFVNHSNEPDYISIESDNSGCWSSVGRVGGKQVVNLQSVACLSNLGTPLHELMHALGFLHEQCRKDRNSFVEIHYENMNRENWGNFDKAENSQSYGVSYDYGSVMHYSAKAFSTNKKPTIVPLLPELAERMGQRDGFSAYDVEKLNRMYCSDSELSSSQGISDNLVESFIGGFIDGLNYGRRQH